MRDASAEKLLLLLYAENCTKLHEDLEAAKAKVLSGEYSCVVFPGSGLGTGIADLENSAPRTWAFLQEEIASMMATLDAAPRALNRALPMYPAYISSADRESDFLGGHTWRTVVCSQCFEPQQNRASLPLRQDTRIHFLRTDALQASDRCPVGAFAAQFLQSTPYPATETCRTCNSTTFENPRADLPSELPPLLALEWNVNPAGATGVLLPSFTGRTESVPLVGTSAAYRLISVVYHSIARAHFFTIVRGGDGSPVLSQQTWMRFDGLHRSRGAGRVMLQGEGQPHPEPTGEELDTFKPVLAIYCRVD